MKDTYGGNLRNTREQLKISLRSFAKIIGVHPTYLSKIELGQLPPPSKVIRKRIENETVRLLKAAVRERRKVLEQTQLEVFNLEMGLISRVVNTYSRQPDFRGRLTQHLQKCIDRVERVARRDGQGTTKG